MTNLAFHPTQLAALRRSGDWTPFLTRTVDVGVWQLATDEFNILRSRPGSVAVITKLVVRGHSSTSGDAGTDEEFLHFKIRVDATGGAEVGNFIVQIANGGQSVESGTATAGGANTLTSTTHSWATNRWAGHSLKITGGTGSGQTAMVLSNTATAITVVANWATPPDNTSTFEIIPPGQTTRVFDFKKPLIVPPGHKVSLVNTVTSPLTTGMVIGWFPEIHGGYLTKEHAVNMGLYDGLENWFCEAAIPANTTTTELVPAVAGKSIQIDGYLLQGLTLTGAGDLRITHDDATTDRTVLRMYTSSNSQVNRAELFASGVEMNMPVGNSVNYTASANMGPGTGGRGCVSLWGKYTKDPNTFNPNGFHGIQGIATATAAAGASTLTDTSKEWTTNALAGVTGKIVRGTGAGATFTISSNTATVLTMSATWTTNGAAAGIDNTSEYVFTVADGAKWWVAVDAGANTTRTDTAYLAVPSLKESLAEVEHMMVSGDSNSVVSASPLILVEPAQVALRAALGARKGAAVANAGVAGVYTPGLGLDGVNGTGQLVLTPFSAVQPTLDMHQAVDGMSVAVAVGPPVAALASSAFVDSRVLNIEVSNGWTNVFAVASGRFLDPAALSQSTAALGARLQTNTTPV